MKVAFRLFNIFCLGLVLAIVYMKVTLVTSPEVATAVDASHSAQFAMHTDFDPAGTETRDNEG